MLADKLKVKYDIMFDKKRLDKQELVEVCVSAEHGRN